MCCITITISSTLADEAGVDGMMINEHPSAFLNMKPSANLDAAVISRLTEKGPNLIIRPRTNPNARS